MKNPINIQKTLFINAGAGTGKTYRLTHDLADFLTGSNANEHNNSLVTIEPQEVIVTTFSKAAAAEIKERARKVLLDQGRTADAMQIETASIGTIHSVAQRFINKYWYMIGACPNQEVLSEEDKKIYRNQSLAVFLEDGNKYQKQRDAINAFFKEFKPKKMINKISVLNPEFWVDDVEEIVQKVTYYQIDDLTDSKYKSIDEIERLFVGTMDAAKVKIITDCVEAVFEIAEDWLKNYEEYKRQMGVIDYDDMEKEFYRLLTDESCMEMIEHEISSKYKLVMVDEFQDCNPMQLRIFSRISEIISANSELPYSSIWVGDPNQAIYGFRGSDTELINRVKTKFTEIYPNSDSMGLSKDSLKTSYRSREKLVEYANNLFGTPFFKDYTELDADRKDDSLLNTPVLQWNFQRYDARSGWNKWRTSFARQIKDMVENKEYKVLPKDEKEPRDIQYKDIAILAFKNDEIQTIVKTLREEGVPASAPESNILDRAEVQLVLAILNLRHTVYDGEGEKKTSRVETRPHEVATLLKLWLDKTTEEVISERIEDINSGNNDWAEKYPELQPVLVALDDSKGFPLDEKIRAIILELDLYDKVEKWGDADVRRQNLNTLQKVASQFVARCSRMGIKSSEKEFDKYLKATKIKSDIDRTSDSVTVCTYHGSKGLEWPMVILTSLDGDPLKDFVKREYFGVHEVQIDNSEDIISGYYIHYVPYPDGAKDELPSDSDLEMTDVCNIAKARVDGESKRLFYVGLTRARDYVVYACAPTITGSNPDGKVRWVKDFTWLNTSGLKEEDIDTIVEIFPPLIPNILKEPKEPKRPKNDTPTYLEKKAKYEADLNAYRDSQTAHEDAKKREEDIAAERKAPKPYILHDIDALEENLNKAKYRHPSVDSEKNTEMEKKDFIMELLPLIERVRVASTDAECNDVMKYRHAVFGTCIHNIYAVCPWRGHGLTETELSEYYDTATSIVNSYGLHDVISDVKPVIKNLLCLLEWLKGKYGAPKEIVTEYPFNFPYGEDDKQIVAGEIDMVYRTEKTDIIIDFKTHIGDDKSLGNKTADGKYKVNFLSNKYVPQLNIYRNIWQKAYPNINVVTYLYYNMLGGVVEICEK